MTHDEFIKVGLNEDDYVSVEFNFKGRKITSDPAFFSKYRNGNVLLLTKNWANDFYSMSVKDILTIKKINQ